MKICSTSPSESGGDRQVANAKRDPAQLQKTPVASILDTRAVSVMQLNHQQMANNSIQAKQLRAHAETMAGAAATRPWQTAQGRDSLPHVERGGFPQGEFDTAQRVEDEGVLQGNFAAQPTAQPVESPNSAGLPKQLKTGIELLSGMSMDHVKVHYNSDKPAQLNAHAYAQGSEIHVAPGQTQHLPHEAWHVVQQAQGRVRPTTQMKMDVPVNDDVELEAEADMMGAKALTHSVDFSNSLAANSKTADTRSKNVEGVKPRQFLTQNVTNRDKTLQRRLADPTGLDRATRVVQNGARQALIETLLDLQLSENEEKTKWLGEKVGSDANRKKIEVYVEQLSEGELIKTITEIRKKFPDQAFDSTKYRVEPAEKAPENLYLQELKSKTVDAMKNAASDGENLMKVFGDGVHCSPASFAAMVSAEGKIIAAADRLPSAVMLIDTSGISARLGFLGLTIYDQSIFLPMEDSDKAPDEDAIVTLFHEAMHLAHKEIQDNGGYSSDGASFTTRDIATKLANADHYAEIARIHFGLSSNKLPFSPASANEGEEMHAKEGDVEEKAMNAVRTNMQERARRLWIGGLNLFGEIAGFEKLNNSARNKLSKLLNMTYHKSYFWPDITEVDKSLAEATVNRLYRFLGSVNKFAKDESDEANTKITKYFNTASGDGEKKLEAAGEAALEHEAKNNGVLAPHDIPNIKEISQLYRSM